MIIKNITGKQISTTGVILPFKKNINGHRILDYDIKYNDHKKVIEVSDSKIFNQLSNLSKNAFTALDGKSLGRIDIKMNHRSVSHFIEANLMPCLQKGYFYRSCLLNLNMSYEQMILPLQIWYNK